jgi:hypothetical protein
MKINQITRDPDSVGWTPSTVRHLSPVWTTPNTGVTTVNAAINTLFQKLNR